MKSDNCHGITKYILIQKESNVQGGKILKKVMQLLEIDRLGFSSLPSSFDKSLGINQTKDKRYMEISQIIY